MTRTESGQAAHPIPARFGRGRGASVSKPQPASPNGLEALGTVLTKHACGKRKSTSKARWLILREDRHHYKTH